MNKQKMNILCATDRNFLYPTYVFMQSVMENHPHCNVNFFLTIGDDVTEEDQRNLKKHILEEGYNITFIKQNIACFDNFILSERFPKAVYFRLMAHKYLPKSIDRILYLDVDIIVDKDITEFYNTDFEGKYLVATSHNPDPRYFNMLNKHIVNYEAAGRGEFFNSGVLLMNLNKFRENITEQDYLDAYKVCEQENISIFYDQGLLNYMFYDKTKYFSSMDYNFRFSIPKTYPNRIDPEREYKKAIIHYTGMKQPYKPWDLRFSDDELKLFKGVPFSGEYFYISKELNDILEIWWTYAEKTPVYEIIKEQVAIKTKWFKRNLLEFMVEHNKLVNKIKNQQPVVKTVKESQVQKVLPSNFHHKAYKLGCFMLWPILKIKDRRKRKQLEKARKNKS